MRTTIFLSILLTASVAAATPTPQDSGHHLVADTLRLTLAETVELAQRQSNDALAARHTLAAAEWSYRYYKANYLPAVSLSSAPTLNRQVSSITQPDGTNVFVRQNQLNTTWRWISAKTWR